jgi:hypothetical protein
LIWGNRLAWGGRLAPGAAAWSQDVIWGAADAEGGQTIEWGVICSVRHCNSQSEDWRTWTAADSRNAVWGTTCGGADCIGVWSPAAASDGDTVVWGTSDGDTVVWGTSDGDTVVWGTSDGDTVVWGTSDGDTVVWGTSCEDPSCMSQPWGH